MQIQYCSDLHLEFDLNKRFLQENPLPINGEILILAGDIILLKEEYLKHPFFDFVSDNYEMVFWVPGNHEYYKSDIKQYRNRNEIKVRKNVFWVNNCVKSYKNVCFLFSTLWSRINSKNEAIIEQRYADFKHISIENKKLKPSDYNLLHLECLNFLDKEIKKSTQNTIVITHHVPSDYCIAGEYKDSCLNDAFCTDLTSVIETSEAKYWIYGHNHFNHKPLLIGKTTLITNQLGYIELNENIHFKNDAFITL